ncbi:hypothetical protein [Haloferula sp.]|uniref:hypothetical protein n=1 Tax=Haloferula sp. TaxID=2497595 RepID=UPI003C797139
MPKFVLLAWISLLAPLAAQAVLAPPFGLSWGDSPEKLIEFAGRHELDVRITIPGDQPDLREFRVQSRKNPLPSSTARALDARFHSGRLFEVTLHYGKPGESADRIEGQFNEMKRQLTVKHGDFIPNQQARKTEDNFSTRTLSFHHEPVKGLFLNMVFTEMEDLLRKTREASFSLIYRNDNLLQQLEAAAAERK